MARMTLRHIVFGLAATGLLTACVDGTGTGAVDASASEAPVKVRVGQDIEAPEVFQANESALWDGRPSLGGTWVASPDAVDPERVVMFNPATGKSVTGALFRRERENPGPRLQLSSDAAEALGVLAGQPTEIKVIALRKQEAPEEVVPETPTETESEALEGEAPEAETVETDAAGTEDAAGTAAAAVAALDAVDADAAGADPAAIAAEPAKLTAKERRAMNKAERQAKKAAAAAAKAAAAAAETDAAALGAEAVAATAETAGVAAIETAPLDARIPDIGSAPIADPAPASPKAAETAADPVEAAPAPSGAVRPIQIASFSKEENATRAVQALAKIGITAQTQKSDKGGKIVWGVVSNGDAAMLQTIKDAGFADAYFLK